MRSVAGKVALVIGTSTSNGEATRGQLAAKQLTHLALADGDADKNLNSQKVVPVFVRTQRTLNAHQIRLRNVTPSFKSNLVRSLH